MKILKEMMLIGLGIVLAALVFAAMIYVVITIYDVSYVTIVDAVSGRIDTCITVNSK